MVTAQLGAYQTVSTTTADPGRLVLQLYDSAIRFLRDAQRAHGRGDIGGFAKNQARAHAIVGELAGSLNLEAGGEVAANLERLYDFMLRHLAEGLVKRSPAHLDRVVGLLRELRAGFEVAVQAPRARA
jgi:flagellar protein FliS